MKLKKVYCYIFLQSSPSGYVWSHPKFEKLVDVIKNHFKSFEESGEKTKAIVFCQV